jgi:dihydrofolate reductase
VGKVVFVANVSVDGFTEAADGAFDWAPPDDDVFASITELLRTMSVFLYGRRMYETMAPWETEPSLADQSPLRGDFAAAWQSGEKIVYSTTLATVPTARTRVERHFDPDLVRGLKASADGDVMVGGPMLAAELFRAGLVDECHLFVWPVLLSGSKPALPAGLRLELALLEARRVGNGVVHLRYAVS